MSVRGWADTRKGTCWLRANISLESEVPEESSPLRQSTGKGKANEGQGGPRREGYVTMVSREHERTKRGWADFRKDPSAKSPTLIPTCHAGIWLSAAFEQPLFGLLHPSMKQQGAGSPPLWWVCGQLYLCCSSKAVPGATFKAQIFKAQWLGSFFRII